MIHYYDISPWFQFILLLVFLALLTISIRNLIINIRHIYKVINKIFSGFVLVIQFVFFTMLLFVYHCAINQIDVPLKYEWITKCPLFAVFTMMIVVMGILIYETIILQRLLKNSPSEMSIKESIDELPTSICYYDDDGLVLLSNNIINEDAIILMGHRLLNGKNFWNILNTPCENSSFIIKLRNDESIVIYANGVVKNYKRFEHRFENGMIYEIIGTDISEEYHLFEQFETKNEQLRAMNNGLKKYNNDVTKLTVEKEILDTKIRIHNDLGTLLLQTKFAIEQNADMDDLINLWDEKVQLFLINENEVEESNKIEDLINAAKEIGVDIVYEGYKPTINSNEEKIIAHALHICLTNVVLHANGTKMNLTVLENDNKLKITITNNGLRPEKEIKEGGGLSSLRSLVEKENGQMYIKSIPEFELAIYLNH